MKMIQQLERSMFGPACSAPDCCVGLIALMESVPRVKEGTGLWQGHFPLGAAKAEVTRDFQFSLFLSFF